MNAIYNLFKKDFLLIKKYLLPIIGFIMVAPIFISYRTPAFQQNGNILYSMLVLMITFMVYHAISMEEMKQKGEIYLRITPMSINKVVMAKYVLVTFIFIVTTALFLILSHLPVVPVGKVDIKNILLFFAVIEIFFGIYIPMTFKLGYVKLQMISAGIIFISPFVISLITKYLGSDIPLIATIENSSIWMVAMLSLLITGASISLGIMASNKSIKNKEY
ncbi:ABC-2 transporter permease [Clostridium frigidicarnis]|uniref:ABC-2 family transporter protein n=1 Tax=Clostridium frigidicarnis TaxID=84698 RepID=A0A1I1B1E6_9CLOT|nr:ABC-2 transporter permease [Clostridium frigidicarnis]SFB43622.1 ABC-2 family transporter protein [Clostridium frigidicarnis]